MKIYKRNLEELILEGKPPFYLQQFSCTQGNEMHWQILQVTVAAFNEQGRICELVLSTHPYPALFRDHPEMQKELQRAAKWEEEIRNRLNALNLEIRDGRLSDTPIWGALE